MRFFYFILAAGFLAAKPALATNLQQEITATSSLYKSCKDLLSEKEDNITGNYCFQLISAAGFSIYATRVLLAKPPEKTEKNCAIKKFDVLEDIKKIPPVVTNDFSHKKIAQGFIEFVDAGVDRQKFPLLSSEAENDFAQMLLELKAQPDNAPNSPTDSKETNNFQSLINQSKQSSVDLIKSCSLYKEDKPGGGLCAANISGFLVIHSLAKNHVLPIYTESDPCFKEKNELLKEFVEKRQGCFPANVDLKKHAAQMIAQKWTPEMNHPQEKNRDTASYAAVGLLTSFYHCRY